MRETEPLTWQGVVWRLLKRLDPVCMLSLLMSILAFLLVLDCRHPGLLPDVLGRAAAAEKSADGQKSSDAGERESESGVHAP